jgi:general secretion pathway protein B
MSILLDALKKSEEQRQLGSTPTIHSATAGSPGGAASELQWLPLSMMAFSAIVMAWIGWNQYREPAGLETVDTVSVTAEVSTEPAVASRSSGDGDQASAAAAGTGSGIQSRDPATPDDSGAARSDKPPGLAVLPAQQDLPTPDQRELLKESFSNYTAEEMDLAEETDSAGETVRSETIDAEAVDELDQQVSQLAAEGESADEPLETHVPEPISFWELPQSVRDTLPEIKITVLVYAEEPADRFLLVNGKRLGEKESLSDGVELEEIRREGAVFLYRKYRFLMKG